jgi:hypothetical protein
MVELLETTAKASVLVVAVDSEGKEHQCRTKKILHKKTAPHF